MLSHPVIVQCLNKYVAIARSCLCVLVLIFIVSRYFVCVVVYNNTLRGENRRLLHEYSEPSWNNPILRFLDPNGQDVITRKEGVYDPPGIARRMVKVRGVWLARERGERREERRKAGGRKYLSV